MIEIYKLYKIHSMTGALIAETGQRIAGFYDKKL